MTADRKRKQAVRQYQAKHPGMTYTQALRIVLRERASAAQPKEKLNEPLTLAGQLAAHPRTRS